MLNGKDHKKFTSCGDIEAEMLLEKTLSGMREDFSGTQLSVVLGGSYGRGDGGVRNDRENGILYNDLDLFVFASAQTPDYSMLIKEISRKYEEMLHVDVDFSRIMTIRDIRKNSGRLMMQELKRGYHLVCGKDLLEQYLPENPAEEIPVSEAYRLLLNRGMGLLFAGEKISCNSSDADFILRNLYKAVLGAADAMLISQGKYRWSLSERVDVIRDSDLKDEWKALYYEAVEFKRSPNRNLKPDMSAFWSIIRDLFQNIILRCSGTQDIYDLPDSIYRRCLKSGEISPVNYVKYCVKSRTLPLHKIKSYMTPAVAVSVIDIFHALNDMPENIDQNSKLYQHWLIFN